MSGNEKRRQKSLQRKAAKRKQKKRVLSRQMETVPATPRAALRAAAKWPLYECLISRDWQVEGTLTEILVARSSGPGEIAVAVFLVDLGLLGVKNAFARLVTVDEYEELRETISESQPLVRTDLNLAAKVIREGIRFARTFGFEPHRDYADAAILLGNTDPDVSSAQIPLGVDGKPFFIAGPNDNVPKIAAQLQRVAGAGNYEYIVPVGGPEAFDDEDLLEDDALAGDFGQARIADSSFLTQEAMPAPQEAEDAQHRLAALEKQADLVVEGAVRLLSTQIGEDELSAAEDEPFAWDVDPALLPLLYDAAAAYFQSSPWDYMTDYPPIAVALGQAGPQRNVRTLYGCVLGAAGMVRGIAFYYSLAALERVLEQSEAAQEDDEDLEETLGASMDELVEELRRTGAPVDDLPPEVVRAALSDLAAAVKDGGAALLEDALVLDFEGTEEDDPTYVEWLQERNLPLASQDMLPTFTRTQRHGEPRLPNDREVRAFTLALEAVNGFLTAFRDRLATPAVTWETLQAEVKVSGGRSVKVRWPGDD